MPASHRPVVLGAEAETEGSACAASPSYAVSRKHRHPSDAALSYQIIANWVIAAHKSQGSFQMEAGRHDVERFWKLETSTPNATQRTEHLFRHLSPAFEEESIPA